MRGGLKFDTWSALNHSSILPSVGSAQGHLDGLRRRGFRCTLAELEGGGGGASVIPRKLSVCPVVKVRAAASFPSGGLPPPTPSHHPVPSRCSLASQTPKTSQQRRRGEPATPLPPPEGLEQQQEMAGPGTCHHL